MKNIVVITAIFALSFATGFTCSKNAPEQTTTTETTTATADQATMATSGDASVAPASADGSAAQPATPTETK